MLHIVVLYADIFTLTLPSYTDRDGEYHSQCDARKLGCYNPPMVCEPPPPVLKIAIVVFISQSSGHTTVNMYSQNRRDSRVDSKEKALISTVIYMAMPF